MNKINFGFWVVGLSLVIFSANAFADEWYENLESSTIKYAYKTSEELDRKSVESKLVSETSDSRVAQNAWGASTQMMIKPSQSG